MEPSVRATVNPVEAVAVLVGRSARARWWTPAFASPQSPGQVPVESWSSRRRTGRSTRSRNSLEGGSASRLASALPAAPRPRQAHGVCSIVFNSRRGAERLALRLNELAQEPIVRAHHGSLAREERLCGGPAQGGRATVHGRDLQPRVRHRHGRHRPRAPGRVAEVGHRWPPADRPRWPQRRRHLQGAHLPEFRGDLLECAVVAQRMREGRSRAPGPAQRARRAGPAARRDGCDGRGRGVTVDDLYALVTRTYSYGSSAASGSRTRSTCSTAATRVRSSASSRPHRAGTAWPARSARAGARGLAIINAGTIPDRGLYSVNLPDGRRVGELDEEMVYEARPGQTFLLGASSWRIEEITRDRVIVSPAPGVPAAVPFWKGDGLGRPKELGQAIGAFARWAVDQEPAKLTAEYHLDELAAGNLVDFLREQQAATRVIPSDRTIVIERFRDEIGDWRLCILSPYGGRVHATWGLALSARIREQFGLESDAIWSDDGIIVHLPDADEPPGAELVMIEPDELEDLVVGELGGSALFGARFRENAGRALLIPRAYPGKRTPLWQQRLKSQSLLEVAKRYGQFPIVLETYRECLRDVLDVPGLHELLRSLHSRELSLVEVETPTASPFASSLLFDYVATYMYEGDTPNAERRAAALALDRDLLRELLGQDELRELIDPDALEQVEADLQRLSERTRADSADALHDVLRRLGDLAERELHARGGAGRSGSSNSQAERRAVPTAGRRRAALDRRRGRRAVPRRARVSAALRPARGLPRGRPGRDGAPRAALRPHPRPVRGGRAEAALRARPHARAGRPRARRRAGARRAAARRHGARVVRHRGAAAAAPRLAGGAAQGDRAGRPARAGTLHAELAGRRPPPRVRRGDRPPARRARPAPGPGPADRRLGARRAAAPRRRLLAVVARPAVLGRRDRLGRRRRARPPLGPRRPLLPRGRAAARGAPGAAGTRGRRARRAARPPGAGRLLLQRSADRRAGDADRGAGGGAVGPRVGGRGDQRRLGAAALAEADRRRAVVAEGARRAPPQLLRAPARRTAHRPGPLVADRSAVPRATIRPPAAAPRPSCCSSATASSRASRCWPRASPAASPRSTTR